MLARSAVARGVAYALNGAALPITLGFDAATPHQISINAPHVGTLAEGTTARVDYRVNGQSTWIDGGYLYRTRTAYGASSNSFAGWIVGLEPGTTYDVRVEVIQSGVTTYAQSTRATRSLPVENQTANKSATTSTFSSVMSGAAAGDVISLAAGTYTLSGFSWTSPGSSGSPVVIRGAGIDSTILVDATGTVIDLNGSYCTFEDMTIRGSQSDSGTDASSVGVVMNVNGQTNVTFRHMKFDGCDQGIKVWSAWAFGLLVYDCEFVGNNTWDKTYTIPGGETYPNLTWNDTGVHMPGEGNCVWNCTFTGHGDAVKLGYQGVYASRACYMHHNWLKRCGDDAFEMDEADGNCAVYDNIIANSASSFSCDGVFSGPFGFFRNVCVNQTRFGCAKFTSTALGVRILNNTFVGTTRQAGWDFGMYNAAGDNYDYDYRNNIFIYRGADYLISSNQAFVNPVTDYSAWYPDSRGIHYGNGTGTYVGLTAAKAGLAPRMANDIIVPSDPFATAITLGSDYTTEYTGHMDATLAGGSAARNAGIAIAGVTNGFTGAAPDLGAVITGQTQGAIGAESDPFVPTWARTATSQTWIEVPVVDQLIDINPITDAAINPNYPSTPEWAANTTRQTAVCNAWCGACYDEATDTMWLGLGGGHSDYAGNEIYKCTFADDAPKWKMVRPPSGAVGNLLTTNDGGESSGVYSDGRPRATHTTNRWVYVPSVGPVIAAHGATSWSGAQGKSWTLFFNESDGEALFSTDSAGLAMTQVSGSGACYDPTRNAIWWAPMQNSAMRRYVIPSSGGVNSGTMVTVGSTLAKSGYASLCYLPGFDCLLLAVSDEGASGTFRVFDCATGTYYTPAFSGSAAFSDQGLTQWRWVPSLGAVCGWNNSTNRTEITKLTPGANPRTDTWTVSSLPVSGSNAVTPSARQGHGTYGRFAYSPRMGGFIVFNDTTGPHYFYKI